MTITSLNTSFGMPARLLCIVGASAFLLAATPTAALAAEGPDWYANPEGTFFVLAPGGEGYAYVQAFTRPEGVERTSTGLFVTCDPASKDGYDLYMWLLDIHMPALDPFDNTLEVLTRRDQDQIRTSRWSVERSRGQVIVRPDAESRELLLEDLASGGTLSVRVTVDDSGAANQPTYQFRGDARQRIARLSCEPLAPLEPDDPFALEGEDDVFESEAVDPRADAGQTTEESLPETLDDLVAGASPFLESNFTRIEDYAFPAPITINRLEVDDEATFVLVLSEDEEVLRGIGVFCGFQVGDEWVHEFEFASPDLPVESEYADLVLFKNGIEFGWVEIEPYSYGVPAGATFSDVVWEDDLRGLMHAVQVYDAFDVLVFGEAFDAAVDHWRVETVGLREAMDSLVCW